MKLCLFDITTALFSTIIFLTPCQKSYALLCFDGSDCGTSCSECEGIACLRVVRQITNHDNFRGSVTESRIALTCLPADTAAFLDSEPAGCRTDPIHQQRVCVCYDRDFCNGISSKYDIRSVFILVLFVISLTAIRFL
uniref:Protein sleepless n=1 Tax=Acrobeloides nanus TaxID=290746 RepID=A0A914CFM9_9BILA